LDINTKKYLSPELFKIWLNHFYNSVDENFKGEKSEQIKTQALNIATVLQIKIANSSK
jgi:hemoglobin